MLLHLLPVRGEHMTQFHTKRLNGVTGLACWEASKKGHLKRALSLGFSLPTSSFFHLESTHEPAEASDISQPHGDNIGKDLPVHAENNWTEQTESSLEH